MPVLNEPQDLVLGTHRERRNGPEGQHKSFADFGESDLSIPAGDGNDCRSPTVGGSALQLGRLRCRSEAEPALG